MAAFDLEEQEQISQIKGWWEQFGTLVTGAAVAAALASVGWQGWQWYQGKQTAEASALYAVLQKAASEKNTQKSREAAGALIEKYNGTAYADMAALLSAKVQAEAGDLKNARVPLAWAATKASDPALGAGPPAPRHRDVRRQGLRRSPGPAPGPDRRKPGRALCRPQGRHPACQGKREEARAAYKAVVTALETTTKSESAALRGDRPGQA
jgi:predicted negative regulator of RcsB-dependent stress response